jgi:hypothetical protein
MKDAGCFEDESSDTVIEDYLDMKEDIDDEAIESTLCEILDETHKSFDEEIDESVDSVIEMIETSEFEQLSDIIMDSMCVIEENIEAEEPEEELEEEFENNISQALNEEAKDDKVANEDGNNLNHSGYKIDADYVSNQNDDVNNQNDDVNNQNDDVNNQDRDTSIPNVVFEKFCENETIEGIIESLNTKTNKTHNNVEERRSASSLSNLSSNVSERGDRVDELNFGYYNHRLSQCRPSLYDRKYTITPPQIDTPQVKGPRMSRKDMLRLEELENSLFTSPTAPVFDQQIKYLSTVLDVANTRLSIDIVNNADQRVKVVEKEESPALKFKPKVFGIDVDFLLACQILAVGVRLIVSFNARD